MRSTSLSITRRVAALALALMASGLAQAAEITVSAAASMTNAFRELAPAFEAAHPGTRLQFNFAASDALLAQIAKGAPVDVFASADQETMAKAQQQKLLVEGTRRNFVSNALVVITPAEGGVALKTLSDLQQSAVKRVAIGRPEGVPAGRYAKAALEQAGLWSAIEPKAVFAQNVRQALDYVSRGETEAGFVYMTDALVFKDKVRILFSVPTPAPISYPIAVTPGGTNAEGGKRFLDFVTSAAGQAVLARHGFQKP